MSSWVRVVRFWPQGWAESVRKVICSEMFQQRAIAICYFNVVNLIGTLQLKICEVDVDDIAFGNFDGFPLMKIVGVV